MLEKELEELNDESDDLEYQKQLANDLLKKNWFMTERGIKLIRGGRRGTERSIDDTHRLESHLCYWS